MKQFYQFTFLAVAIAILASCSEFPHDIESLDDPRIEKAEVLIMRNRTEYTADVTFKSKTETIWPESVTILPGEEFILEINGNPDFPDRAELSFDGNLDSMFSSDPEIDYDMDDEFNFMLPMAYRLKKHNDVQSMVFTIDDNLFAAAAEWIKQNYIWDFTPFMICMIVKDKDGNDLLDADTEGNIRGNAIKATFDGKEYELTETQVRYSQETKAVDYRPSLSIAEYQDQNYLIMYDLDPTRERKDSPYVVDWGDGETTTISVTSDFRINKYGSPEITLTHKLKGEETQSGHSPIFTIIK